MSKSGKNGRPAQGAPQAEAAHYDLIPSGELRRLYEKNRRLLTQLSESGRNNSILQTELCSMIEERIKLGAQNSFLESQVASLSGNGAALPILPKPPSSGGSAGLSAAAIEEAKMARAFQEREESSKRQSAFLAGKLAGFMRYRRRVRRAHASLKDELLSLKERLRQQSEAARRDIQAQSGQIEQLQGEIKALRAAEAGRQRGAKELALIRQKLQAKEKRGKALSERLKKALADNDKAAQEMAALKAKASADKKSYSLKLKRKEGKSSKEAFFLKQELKKSLMSLERLKSSLRSMQSPVVTVATVVSICVWC